MAKKKKKAPVELPTTFVDDLGIEREYNKPYLDKFLLNGDPHVFMLVCQDNGHIFRVRCERDVLEALTEMFADAKDILQRMPPKHDDK